MVCFLLIFLSRHGVVASLAPSEDHQYSGRHRPSPTGSSKSSRVARRTVRLASSRRACRSAKAAGNLCPHIIKRGKKIHKKQSEEPGTAAEGCEAPPSSRRPSSEVIYGLTTRWEMLQHAAVSVDEEQKALRWIYVSAPASLLFFHLFTRMDL